jgi:sulfur carrier protein ThiS
MDIWINGLKLCVAAPCTVELLSELLWEGAGLRTDAIAVDSTPVPRSAWCTQWLSDGCRVEVFSAQFRADTLAE